MSGPPNHAEYRGLDTAFRNFAIFLGILGMLVLGTLALFDYVSGRPILAPPRATEATK